MDLHPERFDRVLVTGGTGFIGRHLVRRLLALNIPIQLLTRSPSKILPLFNREIPTIEGSLTNPQDVDRAMKGCDAVIHLGGLYRFGQRHAKDLYQVNVEGTQNVLHSAKKVGVKKLLFIGTAGVLRNPKGLIEEKHFPKTAPWGTPYKTTKWQAESLVLKAIQEGLPACIASPTCPIGEGDDSPTPTGQMVVDFLRGQFPFYSRTGINVIDIHDLTEGLIRSLLIGKIGDRYLMAAENIWLKDFLDRLASLTRLKAPTQSIPWPLILAAGTSSEITSWIRSRESRLNIETALHAKRVQFYNAHQTYQTLDWHPSSDWTPALVRAIEWHQGKKSSLPSSTPVSPSIPEPVF